MNCLATTRRYWILFYVLLQATVVASGPSVETVSATLDGAKKLLDEAEGAGSNMSAASMKAMNQKMAKLMKNFSRLESTMKEVAKKEAEINTLLQRANALQMKSLVERLQETLERERKLRALKKEKKKQEELFDDKGSKKISPVANVDADIVVEITSDILEKRLDTDAIVNESEIEMRKWVLTVMKEELDVFEKNILSKNPQVNISKEDSGNDKTNECPSINTIITKIQQALNNNAQDGIGKVDHAQGGSVVHWLTSDTYSPPPTPSQTLGSVWWSQFIPQDWERLFPAGWEKTQATIPSYIYHSLGFLSGDVAPPEAILQKNTLPGSCWPMKGSSGQVVVKLPYPVVIESVSIDHVSEEIVPEGKRNTVPTRMKIVGYPPCDELDDVCETVGFDLDDPVSIADINYDLEGRSVQTFESYYTKAIENLPKEPEPTLGEKDEESGSCSVKTSCSAPPRISVAAVEVNVLENGGNEDFTCLYRLRVHGEPKYS